MAVTPDNVIGIAAYWREVDDPDVGKLSRLQVQALRGMMSLAYCAGTGSSKDIKTVTTLVAVIPIDLQDGFVTSQLERSRKRLD